MTEKLQLQALALIIRLVCSVLFLATQGRDDLPENVIGELDKLTKECSQWLGDAYAAEDTLK